MKIVQRNVTEKPEQGLKILDSSSIAEQYDYDVMISIINLTFKKKLTKFEFEIIINNLYFIKKIC